MNHTHSAGITSRTRTLSSRIFVLTLLGILFGLLLPMFATPTAAAANVMPFRVLLPMVMATQPAIVSANTTPIADVVELTNALRQQHGCPALTISPELTAAASLHSQDMADHNYFSHADLSGQQSGDRARQAGYNGTAGWENIAAGYASAADVVAGWYNETPPNDGHRQNLLNCSLTEIGVGYANQPGSQYGTYWTQDFGQRLP